MKALTLLTLVAAHSATALPLLTLDQQFDRIEKGAASALDSRQFTLDGVTVTGWLDGDTPVIIGVPRQDEMGVAQGESRYYFKGGKLFGVREPESRFGFEQGHLVHWLDEQGQPQSFVGKLSLQQREQWLNRRAAQLQGLFAPSAAEQQLEQQQTPSGSGDAELARRLCHSKLVALSGDADAELTAVEATQEQVSGTIVLHPKGVARPFEMQCRIVGYRVAQLTWQAPKK